MPPKTQNPSRPQNHTFLSCGFLSTLDAEEMFLGMILPGELSREHLRVVVGSMDPEATGKIGLRELVTFVRARQGWRPGKKAGKAAEDGLRRWVTLVHCIYRLSFKCRSTIGFVCVFEGGFPLPRYQNC